MYFLIVYGPRADLLTIVKRRKLKLVCTGLSLIRSGKNHLELNLGLLFVLSCLRVNVTSPRQIPTHILMSLANKLPCILVFCKAQWKEKEDKAGRKRGGKTVSVNGQASSSPSPRKQRRTETNGGKWLWSHLRCPNDPPPPPRGFGSGERWRRRTLCFLAFQVTVTVVHSGLCCCVPCCMRDVCQALSLPFVDSTPVRALGLKSVSDYNQPVDDTDRSTRPWLWPRRPNSYSSSFAQRVSHSLVRKPIQPRSFQ